MGMLFVPIGRDLQSHKNRQIRLEHAGYSFDKVFWSTLDCEVFMVKRPDGDVLDHFKFLGHALNRAEKDISFIRSMLGLNDVSENLKVFWNQVLENYEVSGTDDFWADRV